jgi:hypothetical protein
MSLVKNLREYLLGIDAKPVYILPLRNLAAATGQIVRWWLERWVAKRLERADVLERMKSHTLVHPIRHGARVLRPRTDPDQHLLFEEWEE